MKNIIRIAILITFSLLIMFCFTMKTNIVRASYSNKKAMYMWEVDNVDYEQYDKLIKYLDINKVYAYMGTANLNSKIKHDEKLLLSYNKSSDIDTYLVYDENYDSQQTNLNRIKEFIDEVNNYNNNSKYKISGIAIDSEFHTLSSYKNLSTEEQVQVFNDYVNAMKSAYEYAKQYNIKYVVCIPVWLDKLDINLLESLIKDGCDYVQLMNYSKSNMLENIREEIEIASRYNKKIENIAELQNPNANSGVTDEISFYNNGIESCNDKFKEIDRTYNYELLSFSYHYYKPLLDLSQSFIDISNKYSYELYPKDIDGNNINLNNVYLQHEDNKLYPIYIYDDTNNRFVIHFYGLDYGVSYNVVAEDSNYELIEEKNVIFDYSEDKIKSEDIYCKNRAIEKINNPVEEEIKEEKNITIDEDNSINTNENIEKTTSSENVELIQSNVVTQMDVINAEIILNNLTNNDNEIKSSSEIEDEDSDNTFENEETTKKSSNIKKKENTTNKKDIEEEKKEEKLEEQTDYKVSMIIIICLISISVLIIIKNVVNKNN